ncbi:HAD family phosphatase [Microbacterium sp. NPDC019599]|uniref:HAD family hydrolase n=1 Tax=Microbacterium sp. NPDC019599 TaxID=3154690 RepID=UPI003400BA56
MARMRFPAAVLWDMDGTLIDSEPSWIRSQLRLVAEHDGVWTWENGLGLIGADMEATAQAMHDAGVLLGDDEIIDRLTREVCADLTDLIEWRPGAYELVGELAALEIPQAIVTTSPRDMALIIAAKLPVDAIRLIVAGEDVAHGKPHPDPYQTAARRLGVDAARCVAIEDSPTGLASAVAAGTIAIAVPHDAAIPDDPRYDILSTLSGLTAKDLGLLASTRGTTSG